MPRRWRGWSRATGLFGGVSAHRSYEGVALVNWLDRTRLPFRQAEAAYLAGRSLKVIAKEVGIEHERLSRLLRERGVNLRDQSPARGEIAPMKARYDEGMSLERIGTVLGYSLGTVRAHLLAPGSSCATRTGDRPERSGRSVIVGPAALS